MQVADGKYIRYIFQRQIQYIADGYRQFDIPAMQLRGGYHSLIRARVSFVELLAAMGRKVG